MAETATQTRWPDPSGEAAGSPGASQADGQASPRAGIRAFGRALLRDLTRPVTSEMARRALRLAGFVRVTVAIALPATALVIPDPALLAARDVPGFVATSGCYAAAALMFLILHRQSAGARIVPVEVLTDIVAITLLAWFSGGVASGVAGLLIVFVGAASLALTARYALFAAALAALAVLGQQAALFLEGMSLAGEFISAGMLGAIILMTAAIANPLARRIEESEALAHQRGIDLANLAQLNDYVIQNLRESIVVVDAADQVRLMNQSAAEVLGARSRAPGQPLQRVSAELQRVLAAWRRGDERAQPPSLTRADGASQIIMNIAPLEGRPDGPLLVFLEDAGLMAEKVQQAKLAALGRLTASIAHEIRNPVGAMSHAGQLLEESEGLGGEDKRLLQIIRTNSRRVSGIVDSILQLSRREASKPRLLTLSAWVDEFVEEFVSTLDLFEGQVGVQPGDDVEVRMDPGHLHQIVWNLCENAVKYASEAAGGISVELAWGRMPSTRRPFLAVLDRGPGIPDTLRDQVFEPFATGPNGGTGLGLFISRELCELNRATLVHEPRKGGGSIFRIVFADPGRWAI